jgi:hypothetical protein
VTLTYRSLCYLYAFDNRLPVQDGLAFESLLRATRLDYSVQSLERIDIFLDALRKTRKITEDSYLNDPAIQNLLLLLAFYVGEVIGRSIGAQPQWSTYEEVASRERQANGPTFENSATLSFPGHPSMATASFLPLVAITSRLFTGALDNGVSHSAGLLLPPASLERPACLKRLAPVPAPAWPVAITPGPVRLDAPPWAADDELRRLFDNAAALLAEGRVVWGAVIQVDPALFEPGPMPGAPGEILYDPHGRVPDADLHAMARTVLTLKGRKFDLPDLASISHYLNDEHTRVFGLDLPARLAPYPLKVSATWFDRQHLPGGVVAQPLIPVLISDAHPGVVLPLPAQFWPDNLRQAWAPEGLRPMADDPVVESARPGAYVPDSELGHLEPRSLAEEGFLWYQGEKVAQDYGKARLAWSKSAATGNDAGLNALGHLYEQGLGVQADLAQALKYYDQAAAKGHGEARASAERIRKHVASKGSLLGRLLKR